MSENISKSRVMPDATAFAVPIRGVPENKDEYIGFLESCIIQMTDGETDDQDMREAYQLWQSMQPKAAA